MEKSALSVTTVILTKNEEKNIKAAIESARGISRRIVVVDSGSTDDTRVIAEKDISVIILTVPASAAQRVLDAAVSTGRIAGALNFSAAVLTAPPEVEVRDVDIFVELEKLLFRLKATEQKKNARSVSAAID